MRYVLALMGVCLLVTACSILVEREVVDAPLVVHPRNLYKTPDTYHDRLVAVKLVGFTGGGTRDELVYRPIASHPPTIVVRFKGGKVPEPLPTHAKGIVLSVGGKMILSDAVPHAEPQNNPRP